ncbi:Type 1 glutamine amidotransferase-like domain-containing protein [Egicoccus sp. AB-alg2]|uniref:Type 1 glutamine amidotransferase-like domain-containing protein n=1 Tax=Egicoccus sp. AB-alg2 TaxID=3242693 RepID=UPI00359D1569
MNDVLLLGPQRRPTLADAVADLGLDGPIATVNAGWQEREPDDRELDELLGERSVNLRLYARWADALRDDDELAQADRARRDRIDELQALYLRRLHHAMEGISALRHHAARDPGLRDAEMADAVEEIRRLDARHLDRIDEVEADFAQQLRLSERPVVAEHRAAVARLVGGTEAVAIAGGHVAVLLHCLRLFGLTGVLGERPVIAWSAGAMAISERVVLYHDLAVHSPGHAEVHARGLGLCRGVVPLPHARRRLRIDDHERMALLARRFAPARCVVLDDGARLSCPDGATGATDLPTVGLDGHLHAEAS